ncbi:MAG: hypothetical protein CMJ83_20400 [Planctomycetes bacterium]|nr:hypothetical protein [Planctomycetota bacterium]
MALKELSVPIDVSVVPADVRALLLDADERIDRHIHDQSANSPFGFVPSDFERVYAALWHINEYRLAPGPTLIEWGSGFGIVAAMATGLDFEAYGIEIDHGLVEAAEAFSADHERPAVFARGSFIPTDCEELTDAIPDSNWLTTGPSGYPELGLEPDDFDVVYVYPWPGEEDVVSGLFEHISAEGTLLVTYHGMEDIRVRRKT